MLATDIERTTSPETLREAGAHITEIAFRLAAEPTEDLSAELWQSITRILDFEEERLELAGKPREAGMVAVLRDIAEGHFSLCGA